ncbi:MAG TPA: hypothetical protein VJZ00_20050 [Thermoanaerobaculia bacterium]|nr:hypothetical protein [Thermoanaerobaculia bacterium]
MTRGKKMLMFAPLAILGFALFVALGGAIVRALWNWLLPPLFGFHLITFWQAVGILALSRILFGRFGFNAGPRRGGMRRRWERMTPEERERFRAGWAGRCGFAPDDLTPDDVTRPRPSASGEASSPR